MMTLEPINGLGRNLEMKITVERYNEMIKLYIEEALPSKSVWKASISPYRCNADTMETELSKVDKNIMMISWKLRCLLFDSLVGTHDIQNVVTNSSLPGEIKITGNFVDRSTATGVLVIVYSLTDESDIQYISNQMKNDMQVNVTGLTGTEYRVSVFALEDGIPFPGVVASPKNVTMAISNHPGLQIISVNINE